MSTEYLGVFSSVFLSADSQSEPADDQRSDQPVRDLQRYTVVRTSLLLSHLHISHIQLQSLAQVLFCSSVGLQAQSTRF